MELTEPQQARVMVVYASALAPLLVVILQGVRGRLPRWIAATYSLAFAVCAIGWEIWFTYGLVDGQSVDARRPAALNRAIPEHLNWVLNSLADAGAICLLGIVLVHLLWKRRDPFGRWHWGAFAVLAVWFVAQNVWVELFLYHGQLAAEHRMSWAPLAPTGPWFNPTLFEIAERPVRLQTQLPWILMTPLFYAMAIWCYRRFERGD